MSDETVQAVLSAAAARLKAAGNNQPWREARLLLAEVSGISPATLMAWPECTVARNHIEQFDAWLDRRANAEPLSRIIGTREFWSLPFIVTPTTLDPRADSETVVETALAHLPDREYPYRIIDFGTGTGCLLLALLSEYRNAQGVGVDRSTEAALVAARNAVSLGLESRAAFIVSDWDSSLAGRFDLLVSNPPYIPSGDIAGLMPEVRLHDPSLALDGGADGLAPYRILASAASRLLQLGGLAIFEVGAGQAGDVAALLRKAALRDIAVHRDLGGIDRVVAAKWLGVTRK